MNITNSKKMIAAIIIIALVASMIGVIPSTALKTAEASSATKDINKLKVGDILYSGDNLTGGDNSHGILYAYEYNNTFDGTNSGLWYPSTIAENYYMSYSQVPTAPAGYDSWKVSYCKDDNTSNIYYELTIICEPYSSSQLTTQPKNVSISKGNNANFKADTKYISGKNTEYSWYKTSKNTIPINVSYTGKESIIYLDKTTVASFTLNSKAEINIPVEYTLGNSSNFTFYLINNENGHKSTFIEAFNAGRKISNISMVLPSGSYTIKLSGNITLTSDKLNLPRIDITYLTATGNESSSLRVNKYSSLYQSGNRFVCLINDSLMTNEVELTIGKATFEKIHTPKKTIYLKKKQSVTLPVYAYKTDGTKEKLTFTSNKKKVATVNKKSGKVAAKKKAGTVTITAKTKSGKKYKIKIKVTSKKKALKKLTITGAPKSMAVGEKSYLSLTSKPTNATKVVAKWTSSNSKVISITKNGRIEAKTEGTAKITAKIGKKKVTKTITVY